MEFHTDEEYENYGNYGNSAFSSESDSDNNENNRSKKKKVKAQRSKSIEIITENLPPRRNNDNNNRNNSSYTNSNTSTLIHVNYDNNPPPVKKKSLSSRLFSKMSNLFWWKKKKEIVIPVTMTKDEKKKLKKKKEKRNCCLIIILIIIILSLLGNIIALDVAYVAYRNSPLSNITTLVNNATDAQEQNLKSVICSTLLGTMQPSEYNCDFCWDDNSFYNVTSFCMLKSIYLNAFDRTIFDSNGWLSTVDYCRWVGVKCDSSNTNIIELKLRFPVIPRVFDGRIGRLKTLQNLSIVGGLIGEPLPTNNLPLDIFKMENLQSLELTSTGFRGNIPNTFDKMTSLKTLRIVNNRQLINPMPDSISTTSLTALVYAMQNQTGTIPDFIGNSASLQQSLEFLDISGNQFTGDIPASLMNFTKLKSLSVAINSLTGDPLPLITTSKFAKSILLLNLNTNGFTGTIPPSIAQCESLQAIRLEVNSFTGPIPPQLATLKALVSISLFNNKLTGNIPESIGDMFLTTLLLSGNELTGTIPNKICQVRIPSCSLGKNKFETLPQTCFVCTLT